MKKRVFFVLLLGLFSGSITISAQDVFSKEVCFKNEDVEFKQIDAHTWLGYGNLCYNESIYLVEGNDKAVLIDAGTRIKDLDKIVAKLTSKPVILVATHVHSDHTGSAINYFPELYIGPGDSIRARQTLASYKGKFKYLKDGEIIDLGGRKLEVLFTPGHTPGSLTFFDKNAGYGFSGDSFGSGNLLLSGTLSTLITSCEKAKSFMSTNNITYLFPGHVQDKAVETPQRVADILSLSKEILAGKVVGSSNGNQSGYSFLATINGFRLNYNQTAIK